MIDHFSRKVVAVQPLEGRNAGWICQALNEAIKRFGPPKHLITDQEPVFSGLAFGELVRQFGILQRFGAIGQHGSVAVTERVIKTLKYEWLQCAILIKSFAHLDSLCASFSFWYNGWRSHMSLNGACPDDCYTRDLPEMPDRNAKAVPINIERKLFEVTGITGYRLRKAA